MMCVDFTNLNKAMHNDSFLSTSIDQLMNSIAGHELLSFMDAFSRYNQIEMHHDDREKNILHQIMRHLLI